MPSSPPRAPLDRHIRGRNCDRTVQRSTPLERLDEPRRIVIAHAVELEAQMHRVEHRDIGPHWIATIEPTPDRCTHRAERDVLTARNDLEQFDATRRYAREKQLARRDRLAWASVLLGTVDDEVLIATCGQHSPEHIGGTRKHRVLAD